MGFPILFIIDGSHRHEIITIDNDVSLSSLGSAIASAAANSPNTEEFMSKFKSHDTDEVTSIKVRWNMAGRDPKVFPASTKVTEANLEGVLSMIEASGVGRDILEVKLEKKKE